MKGDEPREQRASGSLRRQVGTDAGGPSVAV